jgi:hypothetical protein
MKCACSVPDIKSEEFDPSDLEEKPSSDPSIKRFKRVLKVLTQVSTTASKSSDGKSLPDAYWEDFSTFLKRAKLGISQLELGIDDEEPIDKEGDGKLHVTPDEGGKAREEMVASRELALKGGQDALKAQQDALAAKLEKDKASGGDGGATPPPTAKAPTGDNKAPDKKTPPSPPKKDDSEDKEKEDDKEKVKESVDIEERSVSKAQQRFMGLVKGVQSGKSKATGKAATAAKEMSKKDVDDFASTPHADLPERVPPKKRKKAHESVKLLSKLVRVGYSYHNASAEGDTVLLEFMKDGIPVQFTINENVEYEEFGYSCILGKVGDDDLLESLNDFLTKEKLCILMEDGDKNV